MKMKKILSLTLILLMLCSIVAASFTTAQAVAIKKRAKIASNRTADDVVYLDFTEYGPGDIPTGFTGNTNMMEIVEEEVKPGVTKSCLKMTDDMANSNSGFSIFYGVSELKGVVKVEMRYKFIADPNSEKPYNAHIFATRSSVGQAGRGVYVSATGTFNSNPNTDSAAILSSRLSDGTWTTLTYILDFDNQKMDVTLHNETTGEIKYALGSNFFDPGQHPGLKELAWQSAQYMGSWVYDYIKVSKNASRISDELIFENIQKGCPVDIISIPGTAPVSKRININVDGKYKYTTQNPYMAGSEVMVTAKNLATFLDLGYYRNEGTYKLEKDGKTFEVAGAGTDVKLNGSNESLPQAAELSGAQLFVPVSSVAKCFGYEYSYDEATQTVYIKSVQAEGGAN